MHDQCRVRRCRATCTVDAFESYDVEELCAILLDTRYRRFRKDRLGPGRSLRGRIDREGQLPVGEAVDLATQVASALTYSHSQGVVHRV